MQKEEITTKLGAVWSKRVKIDKITIMKVIRTRVGPDKVPQHQNKRQRDGIITNNNDIRNAKNGGIMSQNDQRGDKECGNKMGRNNRNENT